MREAATIYPWGPFDLESGVRVKCDVGYLCANFSIPRPLCSRLRPDVRDRQTDRQTSDVRRASSLNAPAVGVGHNKYENNLIIYYSPYTNVTFSVRLTGLIFRKLLQIRPSAPKASKD